MAGLRRDFDSKPLRCFINKADAESKTLVKSDTFSWTSHIVQLCVYADSTSLSQCSREFFACNDGQRIDLPSDDP